MFLIFRIYEIKYYFVYIYQLSNAYLRMFYKSRYAEKSLNVYYNHLSFDKIIEYKYPRSRKDKLIQHLARVQLNACKSSHFN